MAKADGEETLKQKALGFIFEKNPLVYMWNHMWVEKPKPFSEMNKWEKQLKGIDNCIAEGVFVYYVGYTLEHVDHMEEVLEEEIELSKGKK